MACADIIRRIRVRQEEQKDERPVPYIVAVIRRIENMDAARIAGGEDLEVLCYQDVMARIMANSSRHPGMSYVFTELFNYDKNEIYYVKKDQIRTEDTTFMDAGGRRRTLNELGLYELNQYLKNAIVIGGTSGAQDYRLEKKKLKSSRWDGVQSCMTPTMPAGIKVADLDHLYIIEEDDDPVIETCSRFMPMPENLVIPDEREMLSKPDLILGSSPMVLPVLRELGSYLKKGTTVFVVDNEQKMTDEFCRGIAVDGLDVQPIACNIDNYNALYELLREERFRDVKSVMIMSDMTAGNAEMSPEERKDAADGLTLDRLFFIRKIRDDLYPDLYITCDLKNV
jgi:hypothetical protein